MTFSTAALIGFFLGFAFGVGCALAVMYSIFMGGYRAAVRDAALPTTPERLHKARTQMTSSSPERLKTAKNSPNLAPPDNNAANSGSN